MHNLLLVLSGRQDNARLQREKLLRDYPLNATLWWLNWFDGRSESALAQWRGLCQGRDVNALMWPRVILIMLISLRRRMHVCFSNGICWIS
ncbi:Uncharacterised protein [Shigella flexneri]|nr:Uncharacterised protein [Shigella flexneri]